MPDSPPDVKRPFWLWVFSESDGTPSFARVVTAMLCAAAVGWVSAVVIKTHALPDFAGLALFISVLYGGNKFATAFGKQSQQ